MSAIADGTGDGPTPLIRVLIALHPGFDTLDVAGPVEVMGLARHDFKDESTKAFQIEYVSATEYTESWQGLIVRSHMDFEDAHRELEDYDLLVIPGGSTGPVLDKGENQEPMPLIKAFAEIQTKNPSKERTLLSICTGSLFLGKVGLLQGLAATTHPDFYTKLELICQEAARRGDMEQTDVMEERYVVNNARFTLGENEDENPFILRKRPSGRRESTKLARKGSNAWKQSMRRESVIQRASLPLGGLRVITSGGISTGLDAALYLVSAMVSHDSAEDVARYMAYSWNKGVTVDGIDV